MTTRRTRKSSDDTSTPSGGAPLEGPVGEALSAFDANDVSVWDALLHGIAELDRARVAQLREAGTVAGADAIMAHLHERELRAPLLLDAHSTKCDRLILPLVITGSLT